MKHQNKEHNMKLATSFKVINGKIQLFDKEGNKLPGKGTRWEGWFDCSNNPGLTSLEGAPESVGGGFNCSHNPGLTSLEGAPKEHQTQPLFSAFLKKGLVFCDGILTKKLSVKIKLGVTIYKTAKLGFKKNAPIIYVCVQGDFSAHGDSMQEAIEELTFKSGSRDVSEYENMPLNTVKTPDEWAVAYRIITGACRTGTRMFMEERKLKKKYTLEEILAETQGAYGSERFREVVGA